MMEEKINDTTLRVTKEETFEVSKDILLIRKEQLEAELMDINRQLALLR